jgi:hypothetical protein
MPVIIEQALIHEAIALLREAVNKTHVGHQIEEFIQRLTADMKPHQEN